MDSVANHTVTLADIESCIPATICLVASIGAEMYAKKHLLMTVSIKDGTPNVTYTVKVQHPNITGSATYDKLESAIFAYNNCCKIGQP